MGTCQRQYINAVSLYIIHSCKLSINIVIYDVYRYVPINEDPQRMHLRNLQEFHTQQKDPRDKDVIRQWINRLAQHKGWEPEEFYEPYESSSDEDSEAEEQVNIPEEIIVESPQFLLDDPLPSEFLMPTTKGRYVDMASKLVQEEDDVVAYGQDDTEFLFDQDA